MKCLLSLVTIGCLAVLALAAPFEADPKLPEYGGKEYLKQQADLLKLLKYLHQPYWNAELHEFGTNYKIWEDYDSYDDVDKVKLFVDFYKHKRLLPKNAIFNLYDTEHLTETKVIFDVLFHAKNYDTMFKFAAWLRYNINEKMFMYLAGLVIAHKPGYDYHNMPPPYEVCPYQFINAETIKQAHRYKMQGFHGVELVNGVKEVIIPVNYTGWYMHMNPDQKVSYFTEDVGLNAFYYNFNIDYPHWMEGKPYGLDKDRRGEFYIIMHHEIYARYYLERLSNDLGHVPTFNWRVPFAAGYHPALMYVNGKQFPTRPNDYNLYREGNHKFVQEAEDRERRIRDIIDLGFFEFDGKFVNLSKPDDVDTLGNLLQGNPDSYGLHHNFHDHIVPSFLENYASAVRDPLFYSFYKNLLANYWKFMSHMEPYHFDEIAFPGVKIVDSHVDKIETFFDHFDVDITNAIEIEPDTTKVEGTVTETHFKPDQYFVKARTMRLNHKPFNYKLTVKSDAKHNAAVRVYIGPKFDEYGSYIDFEENRKNFVMLDIFTYELVAGDNVITRNSDTQYLYYSKPATSYFQLYKFLMQAEKGELVYPKFLHEGHCSFPKNLMIPKGKKGGMTYQFFFTVTPFVAPKLPMGSTFDLTTSCGVGSGSRFFEDRPMLYPLDRPIDAHYYYDVPNFHFEDVEIFFKAEENAARFF